MIHKYYSMKPSNDKYKFQRAQDTTSLHKVLSYNFETTATDTADFTLSQSSSGVSL
jgi:hypothetical protein